ncbi:hypothetical protein M979_2117 [Buttiauxella noackiae ATCC 51607]|uniref:Uncharacterized protein n=2 Tax=Buttiauxella TaxID=82976 RepID=A0A1B7HPQ9_9ENTR|nr:hypothetical protein [Buttiauxella noackiae]OAT17623.1 hypothetical protein M979_2117 [Buttiauxella noackiae ATCC 51607]
MVWVGVGTGAAAGSVGVAGGAVGSSSHPGKGNDGGWDDYMSYPDSGSTQYQHNGGFDYQGKLYDPILDEPMVVSAETHGDYWEDDMDYSESVSYEGVDTKIGAHTKTDEKTCEGCPPEGKVLPMVRRCSR